ncbi:hypothetical protein ES288_D08G065300v1 [Gossypium darwinii]|uniref:Uncharacterized protein n=2 Tax=Gossypium TaxID=3633 RepID=A0A5D2JRD9_GOSTO|nr:hypothetical protein ES288_D08G065300v1 [Gossypium darwinii]TYH57072.1 hypothetical protein ES332_D08G063800v1 [Gossypium tomentosum]TYH57073.1 hypothetical protein ES332_D08G063800v1 [Gossypium tomentosum]
MMLWLAYKLIIVISTIFLANFYLLKFPFARLTEALPASTSAGRRYIYRFEKKNGAAYMGKPGISSLLCSSSSVCSCCYSFW